MKKLLFIPLFCLLSFCSWAQTTNFSAIITIPLLGISNQTSILTIGTPRRITDYTNRPVPLPTDLLVLADPANKTNANITFPQLAAYILSSSVVNTNPWAGPTNSITLGSTNHYFFKAFTPCAVTGFVYNVNFANWSLLTISNAATTNITFTLANNTGLPINDVQPYTVTNGHVLKCSLEFADGSTNSVTRVFVH